jgi:hypothetical protein
MIKQKLEHYSINDTTHQGNIAAISEHLNQLGKYFNRVIETFSACKGSTVNASVEVSHKQEQGAE